MKNSSHSMNIFVRFRKPAILLVILGVSLGLSGAVRAQNPTANSAVADAKVNTLDQSAASPDKSATDYKSSLNALADLYQNQVTKLEKQNEQALQLFKDG